MPSAEVLVTETIDGTPEIIIEPTGVGQSARQVDCVVVAGNWGAGKTQLLMAKILEEAENPSIEGREIYTNFPPYLERIKNGFKVVDQFGNPKLQIDPMPKAASRIHVIEDVYSFLGNRRSLLQKNALSEKDEGRDILALDEAWEYANSRRSQAKKNVDFVDYIKIGRKLGFEMINSMQLKSSVDKVMRVLATKNILAERHYFVDPADGLRKSYYEYTLWHSEGQETFFMTPEQSRLIHYFYSTTALQAPGAQSLEAMGGPNQQEEVDLMKEIASTLHDWDKRMSGNPILAMKPSQAKKFYQAVLKLLEQNQKTRKKPGQQ